MGIKEDILIALVEKKDARSDFSRHEGEGIGGRALDSGWLARALLKRMLAAYTGVPAGDWSIVSDPDGRPWAKAPKLELQPAVSLSHSRGWIACAVGPGPDLGIDIEMPRIGRDLDGIAEAAFGPRERDRAAGNPAAFYRIWTLREAMAKATGQGMAMVADRVDRAADGPDVGEWTMAHAGDGWWLCHHVPVPDLALSLAVRSIGSNAVPCALRWWDSSG